MHASLFSLVTTEDPNIVFAWGMEIVDNRDGQERRKTVVHIGEPNGHGTISVHESAENACQRWSSVVPVDIVWEAEELIEAVHRASRALGSRL